MRETIEFRIPEHYAADLLPAEFGEHLKSVRLIRVAPGDPTLDVLRAADRSLRAEGRALLLGWQVLREYEEDELNNADLLHLEITNTFEPAGQECGTEYDMAGACERCGAGRRQLSPLRLDRRSLPRKKDLSQTIAGDEWVLSERLVNLLRGVPASGCEFYDLLQSGTSDTKIPGWRQLGVRSSKIRIDSRTVCGIHPLNLDDVGKYRCGEHLLGLNLISELYLRRTDWDGSDFAITKQFVGVRRGALVPRPQLLVSARIWRLLRESGATGWRVQRANLLA